FRYCQHDLGHAIAAIRIAAALEGRGASLMPEWSHADIASLTGTDRDDDFVEAEREEPGCVLVVGPQSQVESQSARASQVRIADLLGAVRGGRWTGRANQLSEDHVQWTFIDEIAEATRDPGRQLTNSLNYQLTKLPTHQLTNSRTHQLTNSPFYPSSLLLQRRSAVAFDGRSSIAAERFFAMLSAAMPTAAAFDVLWWSARIHFALFVHRVDGVAPGLYLLLREAESGERLKAALGREFLMEPAS